MAFDKDSAKGLRRLCSGCMVAAVTLAPWSRWIALALAVFGIVIGVPLWSRRSWPTLWGSVHRKLRGVLRADSARGPADIRTVGHAREGSSEAGEHGQSPFHDWSLHAHARQAFTEAAVRPQNSFHIAAHGLSAARAEAPGDEQFEPAPAADPFSFRSGISKHEGPVNNDTNPNDDTKEVIDLQSVIANLEKRYRVKRTVRTQAPGRRSDEPPVTIDFEEIRRRLRTAYGRRLSGSEQAASSPPPHENSRPNQPDIRDSISGVANAHPSRASKPTQALVVKSKPVQEKFPSSYDHDGMEVTIDITPCDAPTSYPGNVSSANTRALPMPALQLGHTPPEHSLTAPVTALPDNGRNDTESGTAPDNQPTAGKHPFFNTRPARVEEPASAVFHRCAPTVEPEKLPSPYTSCNERGSSRAGTNTEVFLPSLSLLHPADSEIAPMSQDDLIEGGILIEEKLAEFRVKVNVQDAYAGPVITRYEIQPAVGVRGGQVVSLVKDLARALGLAAIRVVETIPGKTCMGLELPNPRRQMIHLSEVLSSEIFQTHPSKLAIAIGKDIIGEPVVADLAKAPHMLVAGTTGSGKSVGINAMILSILYRTTPDEVRFVMIDPKMLELSIYDGIPHLLAPVVTDMKLAANALGWCVGEMERRYRLMSGLRVRNLAGYNQKVREAIDSGEPLFDPASSDSDDPVPLSPLPYIVVVVDELADLMMVSGKKIEELIARLAQKARAAGIHLIIATQRPSVDVITGLIKANIPTRIAFQVSSKIDSRTILDQMGAECLLGQGDMLYLPPGTGYPLRVHGAFVADEEVQAVAEHLKQFGEPRYVEGVLRGLPDAEELPAESERFNEDTDPLYDDAVAFVISSRRASISAVQRQLRIGYNRAARLVEQMEASGLVSPMESNGNRTVLVPPREE